MKKFVNAAFLIAFMVMLSMLPACRDRDKSMEDGDQIKFLIGMSQANLIEPWRIKMNEEIREEAAKYEDVRVIFTDAAQKSDKQIKDVEELLQEGIDLLIISPNDSAALTPVVTKAYKSIPVIVLDRAVEGYDYTLYIGPDNKLIGKQAGKFVADLLGDKGGNVIEIEGLSGSPPVIARNEGFQEAIGQGNIKVIDRIAADWQRDKAEDVLKEFIKFIHVNKNKEEEITQRYIDMMATKTPSTKQLVGKLSGGNQQKIMIGRWLATSPKILILDEPTRGVDVGAKSEIYAIINKLAKEGMSIILISSELPEIINMSDRVYVMRDGKVMGCLGHEEVTQEKIMKLAAR